jgi:hypothetical protein
MLRFGPDSGPVVLALPPLFEEANRTRAMLVDVLRRLAALGIGSALPDLPGQGESGMPTHAARLTSWRQAAASAAAALPSPVHVVAWRGGSLIDREISPTSRWHLSPLHGEAIVRDLLRVRQLARSEDYAGNVIDPALLDELAVAEPVTQRPLRVVRLESDPRAADRKIAAAPPWRASEPVTDPALQRALAEDIAGWIAQCAG